MQVIHIKEPKRKTYSLQFDHEGNLIVKTDTTYLKHHVDKILIKHKSWITKHFKLLKSQLSLFKKDFLKDGTIYNVLGEEFTLKYIYKDDLDFTYSIEMKENKILVTVNSKSQVRKYHIKADMQKFFRDYARDFITKRVDFFTKKYGLEYNKIFIKSQKTKWGSCSSSKNLNFNWHLVFAPKNVVDYVIIHEITHLTRMDHSKRFWTLVEKRCPNFETKKQWLKDNENLILILK